MRSEADFGRRALDYEEGAELIRQLLARGGSQGEWKKPRCRRRLVSLAKKPSTAFCHEAEVGV